MNNQEAMTSSKKQDWETPQDFFNKVNKEFNFTLDVCAVPETAKCKRYFTPEIDGLKQDWSKDICWMNPPYGREQIKWIKKAYQESLKGATVVCLIPARPDTIVWHEYIFPNAEVRFIKGRLKFVGAETGALFPSALVIFGEKAEIGTIKTMLR
ncbi:phage N-6-adenine-methyltransferase [Heyndrickxia oleronia]|uniref:phage N-6-adenine-methyltransferase n=1 Tax=Heyndrickxia oleronia TaxID=38875 RepID=UPI001B0B1565|nr:phage N-6-adenine-methyltransferase [Heyndrickxia oleronia]GIN38409.1 DNA N-6-adenine-methyltransferase of bacteriophage [Heyndrickxia oleronia]